MSTKKHHGHPHLAGEYRWGDLGQLILFFLFMGIWITDSFVVHYSTFLIEIVPDYIRISVAGIVLICGWLLARNGMRAVFGTARDKPELIKEGVFGIIRHPVYAGAILFYLGAVVITLSVVSAAFWLVIAVYYYLISRYEERILTETFGDAYTAYKKQTGMLFPRIFRKLNRGV
jgi:protein-S-isoprenylcysteine O-methyltransferase Ste14